jgi:hypothetical protein
LPLLCLLLAQAPSRVGAAELKPSQIYAWSMPSVCTVITMASGKPVSLGSGFVVGPGGLVATNRHVVERATDILVKCGKGKAVKGRATGPFGRADLALIRTPLKDLRPLTISAENPEKIIGQQIFVIGDPEGLESTISSGLISSVRSVDGLQVIQISTPISHGSSGGPVILANGTVIGVATAQLAQGQNLNFALPAFLLNDLLSWAGSAAAGSTSGIVKASSDGAPSGWKDISSAILSRAFWESVDWANPEARAPFKDLTPVPAYDPKKHQVADSRMATRDEIEFLGKAAEFELLVRDTPAEYPKGFRLFVADDSSPDYCRKMGESLEASLGPPHTANDLSRPRGSWSITALRRQWDIGPSRLHWDCSMLTTRSAPEKPIGSAGLFAWHQTSWNRDQPITWIRCSRVMKATSRAASGQILSRPAERVPDVIFGIDEYADAVYLDDKSSAGDAVITDALIRVVAITPGRNDEITIDRRTGSYSDKKVISDQWMTTTATTTGECVPFDANSKKF